MQLCVYKLGVKINSMFGFYVANVLVNVSNAVLIIMSDTTTFRMQIKAVLGLRRPAGVAVKQIQCPMQSPRDVLLYRQALSRPFHACTVILTISQARLFLFFGGVVSCNDVYPGIHREACRGGQAA